VNKCYNILAALYNTRRIQEYATLGSLIREISIDRSIGFLWHCVQLSTGNFVVSHYGGQHRVCIVGTSGNIIQSYGEFPGSGVGQINNSLHLTVDIHDNVLVADCSNNNVQLLSPTQTYLGDIKIPGDQLKNPRLLHER